MYSDKALIHYGVKGMHWGIRRYQPYSQTGERKIGKSGKEIGTAARKAGKAAKTAGKYAFGPTRYAAVHKTLKERRYAKSDYAQAKKMSDQELRDRINRINLEQNYISAMQKDRQAHKEAGQSVLYKHGKKPVKYVLGIPNNKEFKKKVAKKAATAVLG